MPVRLTISAHVWPHGRVPAGASHSTQAHHSSIFSMNTRSAPYRVVFTGSECTGKSALARALSAERLAPYSDEAARLFVTENGREIVEPDVAVIAARQRALEDAAIEMGTVLVLHDTDLFSTVIYARHYFGNNATEVLASARDRQAHLYLLCDTDLPWQNEPLQRSKSNSQDRAALTTASNTLLKAEGCCVEVVRGIGASRLANARAALKRHYPH